MRQARKQEKCPPCNVDSRLQKLEKQKDELQEYIDQLMTLNAKIAPDGTVMAISTTAALMAGKPPDEIIGMKAWDVPYWKDHFQGQERLRKAIDSSLRGESIRFEASRYRADGSPFIVDFSLKPVMDDEGKIKYLIAEGRDITDRKQAEEALKDSEEKYKNRFENAPIGIFQSTLTGKFLNVNSTLSRMFRYESPEDMVASIQDIAQELFVNPQDRHEDIQAVIESEGYRRFETEYRRKDGTTFIANLYIRAVREEGKIACLEGYVEDITDRKLAEEAVRESERRLADVINFLPDATLAVDTEGRVVLWNRAAEKLTNVPAVNLLGKQGFEHGLAFYGERRPMLVDLVCNPNPIYKATYSRYEEQNGVLLAEWYTPTIGPNGSYLWGKASRLYDRNGEVMGAIESVRDITERKLAEQERRAFYRETIKIATQGKLDLVSSDALAKYLSSSVIEVPIRASEDTVHARQQLAKFYASCGVKDDELALFLTGVGEAMTNALKHAGAGQVQAGVDSECVWAAVSDKGPGIETLTLPGATLRRGFSTKMSMGMGYTIMLEVSDRVLLNTGREGTTVLLTKCVEKHEPVLSLDEMPDTWSEIPAI